MAIDIIDTTTAEETCSNTTFYMMFYQQTNVAYYCTQQKKETMPQTDYVAQAPRLYSLFDFQTCSNWDDIIKQLNTTNCWFDLIPRELILKRARLDSYAGMAPTQIDFRSLAKSNGLKPHQMQFDSLASYYKLCCCFYDSIERAGAMLRKEIPAYQEPKIAQELKSLHDEFRLTTVRNLQDDLWHALGKLQTVYDSNLIPNDDNLDDQVDTINRAIFEVDKARGAIVNAKFEPPQPEPEPMDESIAFSEGKSYGENLVIIGENPLEYADELAEIWGKGDAGERNAYARGILKSALTLETTGKNIATSEPLDLGDVQTVARTAKDAQKLLEFVRENCLAVANAAANYLEYLATT